MTDENEFRGRDVFVDGPYDSAVVGAFIAEALGLPPASALTEASTEAQQDAVWDTPGRIEVFRLG